MYCLHPINVRMWSGEEGHKVRTNSYHYVPCGKCVACLARRRDEWKYRLSRERDMSDYSFFLSNTYDNQHIPIRIQDGTPFFVFDKTHAQKYIKRVRYFLGQLDKSLKMTYLCVSEYGGIGHRPHLHFLVFFKGDPYHRYMKQVREILHGTWEHGFLCIEYPEDGRIHYITKYCVKNLDQMPEDCIDPVFILASKRPYLGAPYEHILEKQLDGSLLPTVFYRGHQQAMPRIYRNKLGAAGIPGSEMSDHDPRLYKKLESSFRAAFMRNRSTFDQEAFVRYCNSRLDNIEKLAIKRQLQRNEKL